MTSFALSFAIPKLQGTAGVFNYLSPNFTLQSVKPQLTDCKGKPAAARQGSGESGSHFECEAMRVPDHNLKVQPFEGQKTKPNLVKRG